MAAAFARRFCFFLFTICAGGSSAEVVEAFGLVGIPPLEELVVVGEGWAGGVEADDLGTVIVLVPSLFVYFAVGGFETGEAGACNAWCRLWVGITGGWVGSKL